MHLMLIGCEWAGKRTLGVEISRWWSEQTGGEFHPPPGIHFHDHYTLPHVVHAEGHNDHKDLSESQIFSLNPGLLEHFQRFQTAYHFSSGFVNGPDHWNIDWYYADAVFGPFYWGFGGPGEYADRRQMARHHDEEVMEMMPDTVLVLVKTSADVIQNRMAEGKSPFPDRHAGTLFKPEDAEFILGRFQEEFDNSLIKNKITIDTTDVTVDESLQEFISKVDPYLTDEDRERMSATAQ